MFVFISIFLTLIFLIIILKLVSLLISESCLLNREELTTYECGFEHHEVSRVPFSLRYFFLTLIFLLFDLEILLLIFSPSLAFYGSFFAGTLRILIFLVTLFFGLLYEWADGSLDWAN